MRDVFVSTLIFIFGFSIGMFLSEHDYKTKFNTRSVEKGYAEYNSTTGKLEYLDKDVKYLLYGEE